MRGLRIKVKLDRWDRRVPVLPVLVLAVILGSMLIGTNSKLLEERTLRLEAERIIETEVAELQRRLEVLRDDMRGAEIDLALERKRMKESFFAVKTTQDDDKIITDDGGGS